MYIVCHKSRTLNVNSHQLDLMCVVHLLGLSRADISKTRKRESSFYQYLFVAETTLSELIDLLDGRSSSSSALLSVTKVDYGASCSLLQNKRN